jgi:flagellar biosynthesis anti-sigma factor FlgM
MEGGGVGLSYTNGIGSSQQFSVAAEVAATSSANRTAKAAPSSVTGQDGFNGSPVDEARLSDTASAVAQGLAGGDVRTEKVAALQSSIAAGTYNVSASDVATRVLSALLN